MRETITRCDMCGRQITGNVKLEANTGTFFRKCWHEDAFDLCAPCADKVQKFIHGREGDDGDRD